jgi:uracil phosphoribosyltransferase
VATLLLFEATRHFETAEAEVRTPLGRARGAELVRPVVLAPILRAGLGLVDALWPLLPEAAIAHLGIYRDEATVLPQPYYSKIPEGLEEAEVLVLDPMLATGRSAVEAVNQLKAHGARRLTFLSIICCPQGLETFHSAHPDVPLYTGAVDSGLDARSYILPGLGDAGDRYFGTG